MSLKKTRVIIIGGTAAGTSSAATIARLSEKHEVILIEQGPVISVTTCSIPRFISGQILDSKELFLFEPAQFQQKYGVSVKTESMVTAIHPFQRTVEVYDKKLKQERKVHYDRLVFATGAEPIKLGIEGSDKKFLFHVKSYESAVSLRNYLDRNKPGSAAVIGAGPTGLAFAESFFVRGMQVTIVEKSDQIFRCLDRDMAERVEAILSGKGMRIIKNTEVTAYRTRATNQIALELDQTDELLETELVVETIGVRPSVTLAAQAGLRLGSTGALYVDQTMKTSHLNIYAAGDCVELMHSLSGKPGYFPRGSYAARCGRIAGRNIAGHSTRFPGALDTLLMCFWDLQIGRTGLSLRESAELSIKALSVEINTQTLASGHPEAGTIHLKLVFSRDGDILGAQCFGTDGVTGLIQTIVIALQQRLRVHDLLYSDFGYHPSLSALWDPLHLAAQAAVRRLDKT